MRILYIHGAGASSKSFNWLLEKLPKHDPIFFEYSTDVSVKTAVENFHRMMNSYNLVCGYEPTIVIGHSLGGIIATACANNPQITKLVTLCAPFGGIKHTELLSMFSFEPLFHDLRNHGPLLTSIRNTPIQKPHLAIVGTKGLPFMTEANDGAVTLASQMAFNVDYKMIPVNHFEVLLSEEVAELITEFI